MYVLHLVSVSVLINFLPQNTSKSEVPQQPVGNMTEYVDKSRISTDFKDWYHYIFPTKKGINFLFFLTIQLY